MNLRDPLSTLRTRPAANQLEVSIFGPGVGECIVVHIGDNRWIVVDSCMLDGQPVASAYLMAIGVSLETVTHVVASHWHDDHHRGISDLFRITKNAKFMMSAALQQREFCTLVASAREQYDSSSGVDEMYKVLSIVHERNSGHPKTRNSPDFLIQGRRFVNYRCADDSIAECWSLSPSDSEIARAIHQFAEQIPKYKSPKRRIAATRPNHCSVAMCIRKGEMGVLLGADLEVQNDARTGWTAVVNNHVNVGGRSSVYKVAHHGSATAHSDKIFSDLCDYPISIVTPYRRSKLPSDSDLNRISNLSRSLHVTATPDGRRLPRRSPTVEKTIRESTTAHHSDFDEMGLVRIRASSLRDVTLEHFGSARQV